VQQVIERQNWCQNLNPRHQRELTNVESTWLNSRWTLNLT